MKIPYNRLHAKGDVLFAARGGSIHSFSLLDGKHISTWQHPDATKVAAASDDARDVDESEPPAKRQKMGDGKDLKVPPAGDADATPAAETPATDGDAAQNEGDSGSKANDKKNKKKNKSDRERQQLGRVPDRPVITELTSTADGRHVLAVSGHDKIIWVFEHDGQGGLKAISQRTMPKRPSAVTVGPDSQIISADKFGDVYALPLIPKPPSPSSAARSPPTTSPAAVSQPAAPAANTLTVHSKRNLEALQNQQRQLELRRERGLAAAEQPKDAPGFELTLLLGHVSMLTALALGESGGRAYVLTGDRDEHVRVSRYAPQAHVIEGFCLGHREFVAAMVVPASRRDVLVSGGGDEELFVWDWKAGEQLSRASVLSLAQKVAPQTTKVAVSGLTSLVYPSQEGPLTYILAICEGVPAIFTWQLTDDNALHHPSIIQLPANAMHLSVSLADEARPRLVVAMDPAQTSAKSLHGYSLTTDNSRLITDTETPFHDEEVEANEGDASEDEVRRLLYTVEHLRKKSDGGEDEPTNGDAAAEAEAEMAQVAEE
ncbi:hypothetical protein HIM_04047 [Hirsutella minnesotensis 3608]|uniref:Uncharacterized protein n=1 Tax=Hirsutella minnesotensis 3608 TaxID=1043627 RepID=A0A0F7ZLV5_9HYPO|nr:hypothetical protein HIM_04047 [Hirsutella minnesotensis 3608]